MEIKIRENTSSLKGFISWERLEEVLIKAGELRKGESLSKITCNREGLDLNLNIKCEDT